MQPALTRRRLCNILHSLRVEYLHKLFEIFLYKKDKKDLSSCFCHLLYAYLFTY
jgi:hypothetical protein